MKNLSAIVIMLLLIPVALTVSYLPKETGHNIALNVADAKIHPLQWFTYGCDPRHSNLGSSIFSYPEDSIVLTGVPVGGSYMIAIDWDGDLLEEFIAISKEGTGIVVVGKYGIEGTIDFGEQVADIAGSIAPEGSGFLAIVAHGNYLTILNSTFREDVALPGTITRVIGIALDVPVAVAAVSSSVYLVNLKNFTVKPLFDAGESIRYLVGLDVNGGYMDLLVATRTKLIVYDLYNGEFIWNYTHPSELPDVSPIGVMSNYDLVGFYNGTHVVVVSATTGEVLDAYPTPEVYALGTYPDYESVIVLNSSGAYLLTPFESKLICYGCQTLPIAVDFGNDYYTEFIAVVNQKLSIIYANGTVREISKKDIYPMSYYMALGYLSGGALPEVAILGQYFTSEQKLIVYKLFDYVPKIPTLTGNTSSKIAYNVNEYHNYSQIVSILKELEALYPDRVELITIGKSWWFNGTLIDIYGVKITNGTEGKPAIVIVGAHHARELITAEAALFIAVNLTEAYGYDPEATWLLDHYDVYVIPVLNVGGHDYAFEFDVMRGNLRPVDTDGDGKVDEDLPKDLNGDGLIEVYYDYSTWEFLGYEGYDSDGDGKFAEDPYGWVDPNRNYAYDWELLGSPDSFVYSGPAPLSEPETQAIDSLFKNITPLLAISLHSGEETVFFPWGVDWTIPHEDIILNISYVVQEATGFAAMHSCSIYESPGCWDDHVYGFYGTLAFTFEIFANSSAFTYEIKDVGGRTVIAYKGYKWYFNPRPPHIREVSNNVLLGVLAAAKEAYKLTQDTTPPYVEEVILKGNKLVVKARDDESGIQCVIVESEEGRIFAKREPDGWTFAAEVNWKGFSIKVINRAGLSIIRSIGAVEITSPEDGVWFNKTVVEISWKAYGEFEEFVVLVNGSPKVTLGGDASSAVLSLDEGYWLVTVRGRLPDGAMASDSVSFGVDITPPTVSILSPAYGEKISSETVEIMLSYSDDIGVSRVVVYIDGKGYNVSVGTEVIKVSLEKGKHKIIAVVWDLAGNKAKAISEFEIVNPVQKAIVVIPVIIAVGVCAYIIIRKKKLEKMSGPANSQ